MSSYPRTVYRTAVPGFFFKFCDDRFIGEQVVAHSLFGDMAWMEHQCLHIGTDSDGYVTVDPKQVVRDPQTGWVVSLCG